MAGVEQAREEPKLRWLRRAPAGIVTSASAGGRPEPSAPRLGVLSGTFNPPTRAHLALAEHASRELRLDEVLFVLPETPPHKKQLEASLEDRAEMLLRALAGSKEFSAAIATHGLFLDIHRALAPHYPPGTRVFFLVGEDAAERILLDWPYEDPAQALEEMFRRFEFAVARRGTRQKFTRSTSRPSGKPFRRHGHASGWHAVRQLKTSFRGTSRPTSLTAAYIAGRAVRR